MLFRIELEHLDRIDREFKKCQLCGRYFIPYKFGAKFCQRPNPKYGGKTCARHGAVIQYNDKKKHLEVAHHYKKCYDAYYKWKNVNVATDKKVPDYIISEIEKNFENWQTNANNAKNAFKEGIISMDECLERTALPPVKERSKNLAEYKEYLRRND